MSDEASFLRRPAHTEAEDWIVYHPDITPTALMLYMRLRGAVMDPSSSAEDWKKESRFTVEQMRRMMPAARSRGDNADEYAGKRTVQDALALLVKIGALRRVAGGSQVPVYDFPLYPSKAHQGPAWGGAVAKRVREETKNRRPGRPTTKSDQSDQENPCGTPHPMRTTARDKQTPCGSPHRVCGTPHGVKPVTSDSGASKKLLKKNPLPPQEKEDEEDHAARALQELTDHLELDIHGGDRNRMKIHIQALLGRGWTVAGIKAIFNGTNWARIGNPARFATYALKDSVDSPPVPTAAERLRDTLEELKARRTAQKAAIKACDGCGDFGRTELTGWHGHDDEDLKERIWALEDPAQAAVIAEMNAARLSRAT